MPTPGLRADAPRSMLVLLTCAVGVCHAGLGAHNPTAIISDEVNYLLSAKYLFAGGAPGEFAHTMKGYSFLLWSLALPFGGLWTFTDAGAVELARCVNIIAASLAVPLGYLFARDLGASPRRALLIAALVGSTPLLFIWVPFAMTEATFVVGSLAYILAILRYFYAAGRGPWAYLLLAVVIGLYLCTTKAVAAYYIGITALVMLFQHRFQLKSFVAAIATALIIVAARLSGLTFDYSFAGLWAVKGDLWLLVFAISALMCLALVALHIAPLLNASRPTDFFDLSPIGRDTTIIAMVAFVLPSIGLASLFHAMIGRLATFRTVASVLPVLAIAIAAWPQPRDAGHARSIRITILILSAIGLFSIAAIDNVFKVDNFFDFVTWLPLYFFLALPKWSDAIHILAICAVLVLAAWPVSTRLRIAGMILVNMLLIGSFQLSSWTKDSARSIVYPASRLLAVQLKPLNPVDILLIDYLPDMQWTHFGYGFFWLYPGITRYVRLLPGAESTAANGVIAIRKPIINATPRVAVPAGNQQFLAYQAFDPVIDIDLPAEQLLSRGNLVESYGPETLGSTSFVHMKQNGIVGPFIFTAGRTTTIALRLAPVPMSAADCTASVSGTTQSLERSDNMMVIKIKPSDTLVGLVRLNCRTPGSLPDGRIVTLPLASVAVSAGSH